MKSKPVNNAVDRGNHHFVLYAKGHYQETNTLTDLKRIMSHRCNFPADQVRIADIIHVLLDEVQGLLRKKENGVRDFILRIREDFQVWPNVLKTSPPPTLDDVLITACLGELSTAPVKQNGHIVYDIGNADPAVLPLKQTPRQTGKAKNKTSLAAT